jgi:hypothetical protein
MPCRLPIVNRLRSRFAEGSVPRRALNRLFPAHSWFRPTRHNFQRMRNVLAWARRRQLDYIEFMLHSSELMPGGSPTFPTAGDIEQLYKNLETLFDEAAGWSRGATLSEFHEWFCNRNRSGAVAHA